MMHALDRASMDSPKAMANLACCEAAGCKLTQRRDGRWSWLYGGRSSNDHYDKTFDAAEDAAAHFLTSREYRSWLKLGRLK